MDKKEKLILQLMEEAEKDGEPITREEAEEMARMELSAKNGWLDEENRAYIYYSVENAMEDLKRSKPTVIKVIKELETIGLIERRKPGQGRPAIVYVKKYATEKKPSNPDEKPEVKNLYFKKSKSFTSKSKED